MENDTTLLAKEPDEAGLPAKARTESHIMNVSIRGLLTLGIIGTVCYLSIKGGKVEEPLYSIAIAALSYYFGQRERPKTQGAV